MNNYFITLIGVVVNLTRNNLRKMILQEMDFAGGTGLEPETVETMIQVIQLLVASGTIAAMHLGLLLEPLIRIHAKNERVEGIDFEAAKDQIMSDPRINDLVQNVEPGMGGDPNEDSVLDIIAGEKPEGSDYELYDPYGDGTEGDYGEYTIDMGSDIESDYLQEARRLRRRRLSKI